MKRHRFLAKILSRNLARQGRQNYPGWLSDYHRQSPPTSSTGLVASEQA